MNRLDKSKVTIYLDMDGVLADFDKGLIELAHFIKSRDGKLTEQEDALLWQAVAAVPHFYDLLDPIAGTKEMFDTIYRVYKERLQVLTGIPKPFRGVPTAAEDKTVWMHRLYDPDIKVNAVYTQDKPQFCIGKESVLIDDYETNIAAWERAGGTGIRFTDPISTIQKLRELGLLPDVNFAEKKAFIFDLDGTLIDTEKIYRQIWPKAAADLGYEMTDDMYLALRSLGRPYAPAKFREWFGDGFDYDEARKVRKGYFDRYTSEHGIQLKKGAIELLTYLHQQGIITAIATATDPVRAQEYLKKTGLDGQFDHIISATMVDEGKPSPKVYAYACEQLGLSPEECVAVEDAPNGILSAYRAGLSVIMVPDQTQPDGETEQMLSLLVESLDEIIDVMKGIDR